MSVELTWHRRLNQLLCPGAPDFSTFLVFRQCWKWAPLSILWASGSADIASPLYWISFPYRLWDQSQRKSCQNRTCRTSERAWIPQDFQTDVDCNLSSDCARVSFCRHWDDYGVPLTYTDHVYHDAYAWPHGYGFVRPIWLVHGNDGSLGCVSRNYCPRSCR